MHQHQTLSESTQADPHQSKGQSISSLMNSSGKGSAATYYLLDVGGHDPGKEPDLLAIAKQANDYLKLLQVSPRVAVFKNPMSFNANYLGRNGLAMIGGAKNIYNYTHHKISKQFAYNLSQGFLSNPNNPERSNLPYQGFRIPTAKVRDAKMNLIALESNRIFNSGISLFGHRKNTKQNAVKDAAFALVHGIGHNANMRGRDGTHEFSGVMTDGVDIPQARKDDKGVTQPLEYLLDPKKNEEYHRAVERNLSSKENDIISYQTMRTLFLKYPRLMTQLKMLGDDNASINDLIKVITRLGNLNINKK